MDRKRKPKKTKKPKKLTKAKLKRLQRTQYRNALKQWSLDVRARDHNCCAICATTEHIQAHHICPKRYFRQHSLDLNVGISLCARHHSMSGFSAETNAIWFAEWMRANRPEQYAYVMNIFHNESKSKENVEIKEESESGLGTFTA